ncbi:putative 14 3 3 protein [Trypanosoma vivax]|uniref:Putative 14-3-3 protein-like protein n=1 Tax=Trypanosoma vivax (strain Y486) TaxID=1055687 RepID=G0UBN9_TRYVY|nr:14-3-3 protein [Trypanosoma vivax]KAH8609593.1 putative 14 3 3 protein [Trypanosoma vivax]CCC53236.1 putative 14-3-3 protein-like protein [Trypanosoma vivax Y486]
MTAFQIPEKREHLIVMARLAEQCERYDEILVCMKRVVKLSPVLSSEERNLLSVAYKNVIGARRACWRSVAALEQKEDLKKEENVSLIKGFKRQIEKELSDICDDILELIEKHLLPHADTDETKVYYLKMKGDYHRYYAEIETNSEEQKDKALEAYTQAMQYNASLKPTNPIRLGLALNFSVFYYEILKSPDRGCQLARQAFEEALGAPEVLDEEQNKEAALIMQLLRDNLALWTEDTHPEGRDDGTALEELE